jgi:2-polyprenyl-3-methyl-5-hydroxy-6-metoxy-1,4-benzoquinol methylase
MNLEILLTYAIIYHKRLHYSYAGRKVKQSKMTEDINYENKSIWETNANYWDEKMGLDGNEWHKELISPQTIELLRLKSGSKLLDIGCGNGIFSRKMSKQGIYVTAFDFSHNNIRNAKKYVSKNIDYHVLDATIYKDLINLGCKSFDGAVANMVLMDIPETEAIFKALAELLKDQGVFVFSVPHPCFNSEGNTIIEENSIRISSYINPITSKGEAIINQPELQYYFHRSISELINTGFKYGFIVDGFEEPVFNNERNDIYSKIPPVMIIRMRIIN